MTIILNDLLTNSSFMTIHCLTGKTHIGSENTLFKIKFIGLFFFKFKEPFINYLFFVKDGQQTSD